MKTIAIPLVVCTLGLVLTVGCAPKEEGTTSGSGATGGASQSATAGATQADTVPAVPPKGKPKPGELSSGAPGGAPPPQDAIVN